MNTTRLLFVAILVATLVVGCQEDNTKTEETVIEFDLTDIPEALRVCVGRWEGNAGRIFFTDSAQTFVRKFTVKCDSVSEDIRYTVGLCQEVNGQLGGTVMERDIYIQQGSTTKVSGSNVYMCDWTVESKNPKQAFYNRINDSIKDILRQSEKMTFAYNIETDRNKSLALFSKMRMLSSQLCAKRLQVLKTIPIDQNWIQELKNQCVSIREYDSAHPLRREIKSLFNMLPDSVKQSKDGKIIYTSLYVQVPEPGDKIIDYDLYDADGNLHHLNDHKGKWLLLNFSSYYCGACRMLTPAIKYLYERGVGENFEIITIVCNTKSQFEEMVSAEQFVSPLYHDRDEEGGIFEIYKVSAYPTFFVVNPDGIITDRFMGADVETIANLMKSHGGFVPTSISTQNDATVIDNPDFSSVNGGLLIDRMEVHKDSVVLHCTYPMYGSYKITKFAGLFVNDKCISKIIGSSVGFDINTQVPPGKVSHCRLTFEPLPKGVKQFDFIAGENYEVVRVAGVKNSPNILR